MDNSAVGIFPPLIINRCPLGCSSPCARIWINETIDHSIICECLCGHNEKQTVLEVVGGNRVSNAVFVESSSSEVIRDDD